MAEERFSVESRQLLQSYKQLLFAVETPNTYNVAIGLNFCDSVVHSPHHALPWGHSTWIDERTRETAENDQLRGKGGVSGGAWSACRSSWTALTSVSYAAGPTRSLRDWLRLRQWF